MARWIPKAAVVAFHKELIKEHGGLAGNVNTDMLDSTLARPQQLEVYAKPEPTIFQLAASYGFGFARNHCFSDGNKRVALVSIDVFLQLNGYELIAEEVDAALTIEDLAAGEISEDKLAEWIKANTK